MAVRLTNTTGQCIIGSCPIHVFSHFATNGVGVYLGYFLEVYNGSGI